MAVRETAEVLTAGEYFAVCSAVRDDKRKYKDDSGEEVEQHVLVFYFEVDGEDKGTHELNAVAWTPKFSELSKAGQFAKEIMGWTELPKGVWDDEQLVGRPCYVRVTERDNGNGQKFARLDSVRSVPKELLTHQNIREAAKKLRKSAGISTDAVPGEEDGRDAGEDADEDIPF